jgi:protein-S-isoprenylcysteine O-methyltransferase Ste14
MNTAPWLILLAVFLYGFFHSLLASLWVKARARHWLGLSTERWYRLAYNFVGGITILPVLALPVLLPDQSLYRIPTPWWLLTSTVQLLAVAGLIAGLRQTDVWSFLGLRQLLEPSNPTPPRLITGGLYRWVRHPLYTAGLLLIWLIPVMTVNLLALNVGLTLYVVVGALFEERRLLREFGEEYTRYRSHTPMLIPLPWHKEPIVRNDSPG